MSYFTKLQNAARAAPTTVTKQSAQENLDARRNLKLNAREQLILFALNGSELYGLEIIQAVEECSDGSERITVGTLYPMLHRFEREGLILPRWEDNAADKRGGPRRCYYHLSDCGRAVVEQRLKVQERLLQWGERKN